MAKKEEDHEESDQGHQHANPLANLDEETQRAIQELQMLEQNFQQLLMHHVIQHVNPWL